MVKKEKSKIKNRKIKLQPVTKPFDAKLEVTIEQINQRIKKDA